MHHQRDQPSNCIDNHLEPLSCLNKVSFTFNLLQLPRKEYYLSFVIGI